MEHIVQRPGSTNFLYVLALKKGRKGYLYWRSVVAPDD